VAVLRTEAETDGVFRFLTEPYTLDDVNYVYINFVENWEVRTKLVDQDEIGTRDDVLRELDRTVRTTMDYVIAQGDNLTYIANRFNTTTNKIADDNNITLDAILRVGGTLKVEITKPYLSVMTIEEIVRREEITAPVRQEENHFESTAHHRVLEEGRNGERTIVSRITRINGDQQGPEDVISTQTTIEPIERVVEVGTSAMQPERR
jgi:uncharacterized protein YabE (DUF348 family)